MSKITEHLPKDFISEEIKKSILNISDFNRDEFPYAWNLSSAHFYEQLPVPKIRNRSEFIFLNDYKADRNIEREVAISEWNMAWGGRTVERKFLLG